MAETFILGRELDFSRTDRFEVPMLLTEPFLLLQLLPTESNYPNSIGKLWFFPFVAGFGFARAQAVEVFPGLNLVQSTVMTDFYKVSLHPYSKITRLKLRIWKTDLSSGP